MVRPLKSPGLASGRVPPSGRRIGPGRMPQLREHRGDEVAPEHPALEAIAVDEERGIERPEAERAELVERPGAREGQVGPALSHRADRPRLVVETFIQAVDQLDPERAVRQAGDLVAEGGGLQPAGERVEKREHLRLGGAVSTDAVGAVAHAAGERRCGKQEDGRANHLSPSAAGGGGQPLLKYRRDGVSEMRRHGLALKLNGEILPFTGITVNVSLNELKSNTKNSPGLS